MAPASEPGRAPQSPTLPLEIWFMIISFIKWQDRPDAWFTLRLLCRTSRIAIEDVCARAYLPYLGLTTRAEGPSIRKGHAREWEWPMWVCRFDGLSHGHLALFKVRATTRILTSVQGFTRPPVPLFAKIWWEIMTVRFAPICERLKTGWHLESPTKPFTGRRGLDIAGWPAHVPGPSEAVLGTAELGVRDMRIPWKPLLSKIFRSSIQQYEGELWNYSDCERYNTIIMLIPDNLHDEGWDDACSGKRAPLPHSTQRALDEETRKTERDWAGDDPHRRWQLRNRSPHP